MCGICGIAHSDKQHAVDEARVEAMNAALAHRGPDDAGLWNGGHTALAMRRLSIIDLFRGHQPMRSADGEVTVVFNGEIYNFEVLRAELEDRGCVFRTLSDTEVILHAYEAYGDAFLERLNGMFAIGLYDQRLDRLLLARDRLGIKPLFYTVRDGALAFASELDALLRSGLVAGALNPGALDAYFSFLYIPAPDCVFKDVEKLMPGEKLVFQRGKVMTERYWTLRFEPDPSWTLPEASKAYSDLLEDSVQLRRISDVPLGAFLSGGLDSSSVVAMLSQFGTAPIKTFTIGFDDAHADELKYARKAARHFGTEHTEEMLHPDMVEVAGELIRHFGEPFADSSAVPTWLVSRLARQEVTVALSGDGGDELFAGYTWLHMALRVAQYRQVPTAMRRLAGAALRMAPGTPLVEKLRRFNADSFLSPKDAFRRRETCFGTKLRAALYRPEWALHVAACAEDRFKEHGEGGEDLSYGDWMLRQDTGLYLPDDILTKVDRMSMAVGLEARVPLLDHRIVEFAATVPFGLKLEGRTSKVVAKHAMERLLPAGLLKQRKQGFAIPIQRWFRKELRGHFEEAVLGADSRNNAYLDAACVRDLFDAHTAGRENHGHHLWAVLMFEHWLRYVETVPGLSLRV